MCGLIVIVLNMNTLGKFGANLKIKGQRFNEIIFFFLSNEGTQRGAAVCLLSCVSVCMKVFRQKSSGSSHECVVIEVWMVC